jgi:hypothetical protein
MRIRSVAAAVVVALALTACGDNASTTQPTARISAPAVSHLDLVATNSDINSLIDQIFTSPFVRLYAHADWNWIAAQVAKCPPTTDVVKLQTFLNQLVTYLQANAPKNNSPKAQLFVRLINDMSSYVNEAIAACPTT